MGTWSFDMTAAHALDPIAHKAIGQVAVAYDLADGRSLEVRFTDVQGPGDPMTNSSLYRYTEAPDLSGSLDFISNLDVHADDNPDLDRRELTRVRTRWDATGAGRADVLASHGDLPPGTRVDVTECWNDGFLRVYASFAREAGEHTEGDAGDCVYADAEQPVFEDFDADAFADDDLVEAVPEPEAFDGIELVADPVDEPAGYYKLARGVLNGVVGPVTGVLRLVHSITRHPPTRCVPGECTWGPYTDWGKRISYRLTVAREGEAHVWRMEARRFGAGADAWRTLYNGGAVDLEGAGHDQGWFRYDFDAFAAVDPETPQRGAFRVEYRNEGDEHGINYRGEGVQGQPDGPAADIRAFIHVAPGGGVVEVALPIDVGEDGGALETLEGRMRFTGAGGTANVRATGGELGGDEVLGVECWDERAAQSHQAFLRQPEGGDDRPEIDPEACVFDDWQDPVLPPQRDEAI